MFRSLHCEYSCAYLTTHSAHEAAGALAPGIPRALSREGHDDGINSEQASPASAVAYRPSQKNPITSPWSFCASSGKREPMVGLQLECQRDWDLRRVIVQAERALPSGLLTNRRNSVRVAACQRRSGQSVVKSILLASGWRCETIELARCALPTRNNQAEGRPASVSSSSRSSDVSEVLRQG